MWLLFHYLTAGDLVTEAVVMVAQIFALCRCVFSDSTLHGLVSDLHFTCNLNIMFPKAGHSAVLETLCRDNLPRAEPEVISCGFLQWEIIL